MVVARCFRGSLQTVKMKDTSSGNCRWWWRNRSVGSLCMRSSLAKACWIHASERTIVSSIIHDGSVAKLKAEAHMNETSGDLIFKRCVQVSHWVIEWDRATQAVYHSGSAYCSWRFVFSDTIRHEPSVNGSNIHSLLRIWNTQIALDDQRFAFTRYRKGPSSHRFLEQSRLANRNATPEQVLASFWGWSWAFDGRSRTLGFEIQEPWQISNTVTGECTPLSAFLC